MMATTGGLRRGALDWIGTAFLLGLTACGKEPPRGIILISVDTLRADATTPLGAPSSATPTLQQIAGESIVFERAYAQANETLLSHASLFTSRLPSDVAPVDVDLTIPSGMPTLAGQLAAAGWRTGAVVAGGHLARVFGLDDGFGQYVEARRWGSFQQTVPMGLRWLDEAITSDEPFFLFLHSYDCHSPYLKPGGLGLAETPGYTGPLLNQAWDPQTYERIWNRAFFPDYAVEELLRANGERALNPRSDLSLAAYARNPGVERIPLEAADEAFLRGLYGSAVNYSDLWLSVLWAELEARGLLETTTVVILSDHGEALLDEGFMSHRLGLQDASVHVPLLVRPPGGTQGRRVRDVVSLLDVAPTVLGLAGLSAPATMHGVDLGPCIANGPCGTSGFAVSEATVAGVTVTDGTLRLMVSGSPPHDPAVDARLRQLDPSGVRLYDASGPAGTESPLPVGSFAPDRLKALQDALMTARARAEVP